MDTIALNVNPEQWHQIHTITISPNGNSLSLRLELRYLVYTEKWYLSIWNASESKCLLMNVPVVSSEGVVNDLLSLFQYMNLGSVYCLPVSAQLFGTDPGMTNMDQFEIQWGDSLA